jgi:hypothetical protein
MTLLAALAAFAVLPSQAAAASHSRAPSAATPVNPATISDSLKRQTGYSASQLSAKPVCGTPKPGRMSCLARVLTLKSTGKPVHLLHTPHASPMHVTGHGSLMLAVVSADQSATTAPVSGTAAFLQWAYDTTWLSASRGSGDTVAIIDAYDDPSAYSDMNAFRSANGLGTLPKCGGAVTTSCFEEVNQAGAASPLPSQSNDETGSWNVEESLDLDAASSLCQNCKILMVEANSDDGTGSPDLETAAATAARLGANQISMSFGGPSSPDFTNNNDWSFANVASLAAAGDNFYLGRNMVSYPAAEADVTAVGGTSLSPAHDARGFGESVWNSDGGATGSGCDTSQSVSSYQTGVTTECHGRAYNDVSADADPNSGLDIYDSQPGTQGCGTSSHLCLVGGTSLATPLTAAYEAVTSIAPTPSPAWAYSDAALLNDIVSGSDGTCPSGAFLICNAGTGWDGPTGNGSVNGDVATGGPGVGGGLVSAANANDASVGGGVYPNGAATTYTVNYATGAYFSLHSAYNDQSPASSVGDGPTLQSVSTTLCGLTPSTTYHYTVAATNGFGTADGYDNTFTTAPAEAPPTNITAPSITGTAAEGQTLSAQSGTWDDCNPNPGYQWRESPSGASGTWSDIANATGSTYTSTVADVGMYITVAVTESNSGGGTTATASPVGPIQASRSTTTTTTSTTTKPAATTKTVRFYRCARTCTLLNTHGATTYKPQRADYGRYIKVVTTLTLAGAKAPAVTTRWIGPITAAAAGDVTLSGTAHVTSVLTVKGSTRTTLARGRIKKRTNRTLTIAVTRHGRTATSVWAYVIRKGKVVSCTQSHSLAHSVTLSVPATRSETVKLVAVRA